MKIIVEKGMSFKSFRWTICIGSVVLAFFAILILDFIYPGTVALLFLAAYIFFKEIDNS